MNDATSPPQETSFVYRLFTSKLFLVAVFSILVYTLAGFFLVPYILKSQLKKYVAEDLHRTLHIKKVRVNPYVMTLEISNLKLKEVDGEQLLGFKRFFIDFELKSIFRMAWTFADISLDGMALQVDVAPDKTINLDRLLQDLSPVKPDPPPPEPGTDALPPRLYFERIQMINSRVDIRDRSLSTPAEISITPINLDIRDLTTLPEKKGPHRIVARLPHGGTLEWRGEISLQPIWSEGEFRLQNVQMGVAWDFLKERLKIEAPEGVLGVSGHYRFDYTAKAPQLRISDFGLRLDNLSLKVQNTPNAYLTLNSIRLDNGHFDLAKRDLTVGRLTLSDGTLSAAVGKDGGLNWEKMMAAPREKSVSKSSAPADSAPPFQVHLENIALQDMGVRFEDHSRLHPIGMDLKRFGMRLKADARFSGRETNVLVSNLDMDLKRLVLRQVDEPETLLSLSQASIRGGHVDLDRRLLSVKAVSFQDGDMAVWRTRKGDINLIQLTAPGNEGALRREIKKVKEAAESERHPWTIEIDAVRMAGFNIQLSDRGLKNPKIYRLKNIDIAINHFQDPPKAPFDLNLSFDIAEGGHAAIKGRVDTQAPGFALSVKADDVALTPLKPYVREFLIPSLDSGSLFIKGDMTYQQDKGAEGVLNFMGGGGIRHLAFIRPESGKTFLSWNLLNLTGVRFNTLPGGLRVEKVLLDQPKGQFVIRKDGSLNLENILVPDREPPEKGARPTDGKTVSKESPTKTFPVDVDQVRIQNAEVDFADLSLVPPFEAKIHKLSGVVNGFSASPDRKIVMALEGQVDEYGSADIKGELAPFNTRGYSDVKMVFRNVEMTHLTPYSAKFAGRKIDSGKISLDLYYNVVDGRLKGENQIIVDRLELGERVEGSDAMDLPLDLAIALLKDANDRIQLGLPVSGSLDDPEFSYGHLVWKALMNVLTKIVTAPFRALASLVGGDAEDLGVVHFEAGKSRITPPEKEKLAKLSVAVKQRPQLAIEVRGRYAPEADKAVLKRMAVRQALAERMGGTDINEMNLDMEPLNMTDPATRKALDVLAAERMGTSALTALKKSYGLMPPPPGAGEKAKEKSKPEASSKPPKPDPAGFYKALFENLEEQQPLPESALAELAEKRADAVVAELSTAGEIPLNRLKIIEKTEEGPVENEMVTLHLNLSAKEK